MPSSASRLSDEPGAGPSRAAAGSVCPSLATRAGLVALADRMLTAVRPFASPGHARITLPGPEGGYGRAVDGLEGFARTFLLAGFRIAGDPRAPEASSLAQWYAEGIAAGTDPSAADRWVRLPEHDQAKVEAASIALVLDLTRPWIWDQLSPQVQERVVAYLAPAVGDGTYPRINWVWFRLVVQTFLRSVGGPHSLAEMADDLATHDTFARGDGWLSDGPQRSYDHYVGWALHLYPTLWARMGGAADLAAARGERDRAMLDRFLIDALSLVGGDGSPLVQGRSLIYRFAAAAPFWVGALAGVPSVSAGRLRRAATRIIGHFADHGAPDDRGILTLGWHGAWPRLAQAYSGPGSPYWASKGMLGIALPIDHPVWTVADEPLPIEAGDELRAVRPAGWLVSGTRGDGIVRVVNHGTDHAVEGSMDGDSPLYARLAYSTATSPVLDESGWSAPVDQTVALLDQAGHPTHRAGMRTLLVDVRPSEPDGVAVGVAASTGIAHWLEAGPRQVDHGSGRTGDARPAGRLTVVSLVRGAWEVRLVRVDDCSPQAVTLRIGGWPVAGEGPDLVRPGSSSVTRARPALASRVALLVDDADGATGGVTTCPDGGPLSGPVRVPWLDLPLPSYPLRAPSAAQPMRWVPVLVELTGSPEPTSTAACAAVEDGGTHLVVRVGWPDGVITKLNIEQQRSDHPVPVVR